MKSQQWADLLNASRPTAVWYYDASKNDGYPILDFEELLSASNTASAAKVTVYPTVVTDLIYVDSKEKTSSYRVADFSGRIVKSGILTGGKINLSDLSKGNYILLLQTGNQTSAHKFIRK